MSRLWLKIANMGIGFNNNSLETRSIILKNQINFAMLIAVLFFIIFSTITREIDGGKMSMGTFRLNLIFLTNVIVIILSFKKYHRLGKHILIFFPSFFFIILPFIYGFVETETYFFNPLVILGFSVVAPLIILPRNNKLSIIVYSLYFTILMYFNTLVFTHLAPKDNQLLNYIESFDVLYKLVPIAAFIFIHLAIYYLRNINLIFESNLEKKNEELLNTLNNLKITQQHLIQSEKMASVGNLISGVAHEINNPLNYITGGLHILKMDFKNSENIDMINHEKFDNAYKMIDEGNSRLTNIISSLMTFSFRGNSKLQKTKIEEIVDQTLFFLTTKIGGNINIIKDYTFHEDVPTYKDKLHHVVLNIIDNAIFILESDTKNTNKTIKISINKINKYTQIIIFNNGPQIPEDKINTIFDPFYTTKDPGKGAGLGLSISYSLIQEHNGYIFAENKENGVNFIIKLPISNNYKEK